MKKIFDTHAHLDHLGNLDAALASARERGVEAIVCISMDLASSKKNLEIKARYDNPKIYLAMGMHPSEAKPEDVAPLIELIHREKQHLHAIGEIGLDFWYKWVRKDDVKKGQQREVYCALLEVAKELDLPAVIHTRGTWKEGLATAQEIGIKRALFHWYSGPVDVLDDIIKAGYYVSTSPSVAYSPQSREAMAAAPIERVLIETDCPVFYKNRDDESDPGFNAEPSDVWRTLKAYCALKNLDEDTALERLNRNAREFFGITLASS